MQVNNLKEIISKSVAQPETAIILIPSQGSPQQSRLNSLLSRGKESRENKHKLESPMSRRAAKQTSQPEGEIKTHFYHRTFSHPRYAATSKGKTKSPALAHTESQSQGFHHYRSSTSVSRVRAEAPARVGEGCPRAPAYPTS